MCGLLGFFTEQPSKENFVKYEVLLEDIEFRGTDATGSMVYREWKNRGGRCRVVKKPVKATEYIKTSLPKIKEEIERSPLVIGHVRAKTQGAASDNNNNHPVFGKRWLITHNGSVTTMDKVHGYTYKGEVDTEYIVAQLETKGLDGLKETRGSAGLVIFDMMADNPTVYLWAHNQTFYLGYESSTKTWWWASVEKCLQTIADHMISPFHTDMRIEKVPEDVLYKIERLNNGSIVITDEGELKGKAYAYNRSNYSGACGYHNYKNQNYRNNSEPLIIGRQIYDVNDFEELLGEIYPFDTESKSFIMAEDKVIKEKIHPILSPEELDNVKYSEEWPHEYFSFDPHNCRVVNKSATLQALIIAKSMLVDEDSYDESDVDL